MCRMSIMCLQMEFYSVEGGVHFNHPIFLQLINFFYIIKRLRVTGSVNLTIPPSMSRCYQT